MHCNLDFIRVYGGGGWGGEHRCLRAVDDVPDLVFLQIPQKIYDRG